MGSSLVELAAVMQRLRQECAWKAEQTHASLTRYLLEETYEVLEAIEDGDPAALREELGDLLLQVYFHAAIAEESAEFGIEDVAADLVAKLVRRNPHVFGAAGDAGAAAAGAGLDAVAVNEQWEQIKATEKTRDALMDGVPAELPALLRALKALERLDRAGRGLGVAATASGEGAPDLGDRLLALVEEARRDGIDPELSLRAAVRRLTAD